MKMNHVGMSVSNIENKIAFYRDMFGMEEMTPVFPLGGPDFSAVMGVENASGRMTMLSGGDVRLEQIPDEFVLGNTQWDVPIGIGGRVPKVIGQFKMPGDVLGRMWRRQEPRRPVR